MIIIIFIFQETKFKQHTKIIYETLKLSAKQNKKIIVFYAVVVVVVFSLHKFVFFLKLTAFENY